ncbi:hypothetical protein [Bacteriovorax stolpii]|uniref:hypothetical protein n=1 Tax=Bacteriovorax stolpii TaxID=960 RepID=UPI00105F54E1|nr:hypothetical protein [Bacteriovorax stolpii]
MTVNRNSYFFSAVLRIFLALFILQAPQLQAELLPESPVMKRSKESVLPFIFGQHYTSESKKRVVFDSALFFPPDFSYSLVFGPVVRLEIPLIAHYKKCFTKRIKARSPPELINTFFV